MKHVVLVAAAAGGWCSSVIMRLMDYLFIYLDRNYLRVILGTGMGSRGNTNLQLN